MLVERYVLFHRTICTLPGCDRVRLDDALVHTTGLMHPVCTLMHPGCTILFVMSESRGRSRDAFLGPCVLDDRPSGPRHPPSGAPSPDFTCRGCADPSQFQNIEMMMIDDVGALHSLHPPVFSARRATRCRMHPLDANLYASVDSEH